MPNWHQRREGQFRCLGSLEGELEVSVSLIVVVYSHYLSEDRLVKHGTPLRGDLLRGIYSRRERNDISHVIIPFKEPK